MRYDIAVIGNDEAALELVCMAGSAGKRVLAVLPEQRHSEWMMGIALRRLIEQILNDGVAQRRSSSVRRGSPGLVKRLLSNALTSEVMDYMEIFGRLGVDVLLGEARLLNRNSVVITQGMNCCRTVIHAENIVVGCGTRRTPKHRPLGLLPYSRPESLLSGSAFPDFLTVFGGDQLGAGFAALVSLFGVPSRLISTGPSECALYELALAAGVQVQNDVDVEEYSWKRTSSGRSEEVIDFRRSVGFTEHLGLAEVGVEPDELGRLWCASSLETWCSGVFGIGDVVGFSADVSRNPTEQARRILNRINHRIRRPNFLRNRVANFSGTTLATSD
jgi:NAD(P) transhydrogenase